MKYTALITSFLFASAFANAQPIKSMSSSEILWGLQDINNTGSALYFAAHPDDENTRLISYLANERHIRTGYLSLTRGDGGQNLIGSEKGPLLGMVRTQELLAARRTDNGIQYFSRAYDFGFSKNPEETFHFWNKDSVLADAVWVIRTFRPDVIICRFPTTGEGGHGHHTASAIIAEEAFTAAADPKRFPEQLEYTDVWQAKRIVWNTFNFGDRNLTAPDQLKIDVGGYNPLLGKYNGEIAAESRTMHKSQGFGSERSRGTQFEYFKHIKGEEAKTDLFDGVDISWNRYSETKGLSKMIDGIINDYEFKPHDHFIDELMEVYGVLNRLPSRNIELSDQRDLKLEKLKRIILGYCGVWVDATSTTQRSAPGETIKVNYDLLSSNKQPVSIVNIKTGRKDTSLSLSFNNGEKLTISQSLVVSDKVKYSSPYWLNPFPEKGLFQVHDILKNTQAENTPSVSSTIRFKVLNDSFSIVIPVRNRTVDPVKGEIYQPVHVVPQLTINLPYNNYLFTDGKSKTIPVTIQSFKDSIYGQLFVDVPKGWTVTRKQDPSGGWSTYPPASKESSTGSSLGMVSLKGNGAQTIINIQVTPSKNATGGVLGFSVRAEDKTFDQSITTIDYDHIPKQVLLQPARVHLVNEPMVIPNIKIGYIPGAGDEVADLLKEMGMDVTILTDGQLNSASLNKYGVIVTGVRAYNTNEKLQAYYEKLMSYVEQGGNLLVQYNTNNRIGPLKAKIGPYPFTITRDRVTDETAPIEILQPAHAAFNVPNKISAKDFEGWVQERGIYYAAELDGHYKPLLRMNDPGEKPNEGSLILAPYGKGNFVYTGLVFFRELPAGVPGAYKLLMNLLALPKNK